MLTEPPTTGATTNSKEAPGQDIQSRNMQSHSFILSEDTSHS